MGLPSIFSRMNLIRASARKSGQWISTAAHRLGLIPVLEQMQDFGSFVVGKGGASGWNVANETGAVTSVISAGRPTIFDVGANNGEWSLRLSRQLNRPAQFYLFECAPYCFEGIEKRQIPGARLFKCAISVENGTSTLHLPTRGSGLASLHERKDVSVRQMEYETMKVQTRSIDSIVEELEVGTIDLLKIDIEGHELFALQGAKRTLEQNKVRQILFEFGSANVNSRTYFRDFWDFLIPFGFRIERFLAGGHWHPVADYTESLEYFRGASLYLARHG